MATKKTTTRSKSNVSKSSQLTQFKFKWWMALVLVGVVAVIGIVILRFSHASTRPLGKIPFYCDQGKCYNSNAPGRVQQSLDAYANSDCPSYPYAIAMSYAVYKSVVCVGP